MTREEAIRKLGLLLEIRPDRGASPGEAASAARYAQKLIDRFELEDEVLRIHSEKDGGAIGGAQSRVFTHSDMSSQVVYSSGTSSVSTWALNLASSIVRANGCRCYYTSGSNPDAGKVHGFGRPVDLAWCCTLVDHLVVNIDDAARRWSKIERSAGRPAGRTGMNSFRLGAVNEISRRLREGEADRESARHAEREEMAKAAGGDRMALMVVDTAIARMDSRIDVASTYMHSLHPHLGSGRPRRSSVSGRAYSSGMQAGARMDLRPGRRLG